MKAIKITLALAFIIGLAALLLVALPSDNVKTYYQTYEDALGEHNYFANGWLPEIFPNTIYDIKTSNNLDLNTSSGKFKFPSDDWSKVSAEFGKLDKGDISGFQSYHSSIFSVNSLELYKFESAGSRWLFACLPQDGYCEYVMNKF